MVIGYVLARAARTESTSALVATLAPGSCRPSSADCSVGLDKEVDTSTNEEAGYTAWCDVGSNGKARADRAGPKSACRRRSRWSRVERSSGAKEWQGHQGMEAKRCAAVELVRARAEVFRKDFPSRLRPGIGRVRAEKGV